MEEERKKNSPEEKLDIFVIGMNKVGKTSFVSQFAKKEFSDVYEPTESLNSKGKEMKIGEKNIQ